MDDRSQIGTVGSGVAEVRPWSAFVFRDFSLIWVSGTLTGIASQIRQIANLYQVYAISGSSLQLGLTGFFNAIPFVFLGLLAGALADTVDRKKLITVTQSLNIALGFGLGFLTAMETVEVWHVYVFGLISSIVQAFNTPARSALVPRLVPPSHLMNAITLNTMIHQGSILIGPALAGVLIDRFDLAWTYYFCGVLFIPATVAVLAIGSSGKPEGARRRVTLRSMIEGVEFIWAQRIIFSLFLLDFGVILFGYYQPILPIFASDIFKVGATGLGTLYAAPAVGSLVGMAALLMVGNIRRKGAVAVIAAIFFAAGLALLGMSKRFWLGVSAVLALGFADAMGVTLRRTVVQLLAPDAMLGRATSLMIVFAQCTNALGALVAGIAAELLGASNALLLSGVLCFFIIAGITFAVPQLWRYRSA